MIPFRTRRLLRRIFVALLVLALIAAVVLGCWVLWLNRYVIYTRDGAKVDFDLAPELTPGRPAVAPTVGRPVDIIYQEDDAIEGETDDTLTQLKGVYADAQALLENFEETAEALRKLSADTAIMLDVKNVRSEFFYPTAHGRNEPGIDGERLKTLIGELKETDHYLIARLPAFREYWYILDDETERVPYGLPRYGGNGALWLDESGPNYWLNPSAEGTMNRLREIITELKSLGFDEVVLDDFRFPDTDRIAYEGDREAAIRDAAAFLVKICATDKFTVSFVGTDPTFPLPEGRSRLYLKNATAAQLGDLAEKTGLADPAIRLVFLTETLDTRFDDYGVLRPADTMQ